MGQIVQQSARSLVGVVCLSKSLLVEAEVAKYQVGQRRKQSATLIVLLVSLHSHPQYPLFLASASRGSPDDEEEALYLPECEYAEEELDEEDEIRGWLWMMALEDDADEEL